MGIIYSKITNLTLFDNKDIESLIKISHDYSNPFEFLLKYFPNKNYTVSNSRLVPMLFGILFIYTIYLLFLYFKNM